MRKDMNKVVTEAVRFGGRGKTKQKFDKATKPREKRIINNVEVDLSPKKESMRKRHVVSGNAKYPSDLLSPLKRFLVSRVGKPWSEVWSEIAKVFKADGWQANHIKDHVKDLVGGTTHSGLKQSMYRMFSRDIAELDRELVYVDKNGILQKGKLYNTRYWRKGKKRTYPHVTESETVEYHQINGAWFRITVLEDSMNTFFEIHPITKKIIERKEKIFSVDKKALSKKEIKKLNLNNRYSTTTSRIFPEGK